MHSEHYCSQDALKLYIELLRGIRPRSHSRIPSETTFADS